MKVPGAALVEGGAVTRGDGRGAVDGEGEGLAGVRADAVGGRDGDRVGALGADRRRAGQGSRPVAVVDEADPGGQRARLGQGRRRVPVVVTVKDPLVPSVKVVLAAEVMAGGPSTVRVKDWLAAGLTPLVAVMVSG